MRETLIDCDLDAIILDFLEKEHRFEYQVADISSRVGISENKVRASLARLQKMKLVRSHRESTRGRPMYWKYNE